MVTTLLGGAGGGVAGGAVGVIGFPVASLELQPHATTLDAIRMVATNTRMSIPLLVERSRRSLHEKLCERSYLLRNEMRIRFVDHVS
jgi:hypothetical protein